MLYKRLIALCDGTWQSSFYYSSVPSNVTRIARALNSTGLDRDGNEVAQVTYYHGGIGSRSQGMDKIIEGAMGFGFVDDIREVYGFIAYNYSPGDEVFFFGFSRGAFTARSVSSFVTDFGILTPAGMAEFVPLFNRYQQGEFTCGPYETDERKAQCHMNLKAEHERLGNLIVTPANITVKVIGCFDTVGALGIPRQYNVQLKLSQQYDFLSLTLSSNVQNAFHALALDETREAYRPTLWFLDESNKVTNLQQMWFTGVHINIGGGNIGVNVHGSNLLKLRTADGVPPNVLADGPLIWMISQCQPFLSFSLEYLHADVHSGFSLSDGSIAAYGTHEMVPYQDWYRGPIASNFVGWQGLVSMAVMGVQRRIVGQTQPAKASSYMLPLIDRLGYLYVIRPQERKTTTGRRWYTNETVHCSVLRRRELTHKWNVALAKLDFLEPHNLPGITHHLGYFQRRPSMRSPDPGPVVPIVNLNEFEDRFWLQERETLNKLPPSSATVWLNDSRRRREPVQARKWEKTPQTNPVVILMVILAQTLLRLAKMLL
ncbi:uncharacterized protein V1510DRAFT_418842 [Dipodascopsis tothii]|uniref:uncharacterized protein n=1 Tax=Dipodascopsis tothii TaxID=44089 RepID=UPI0034CDEE1E